MEVNINISQIILSTALSLSLVINIALAVKVFFIRIGDTDKSKRAVKNSGNLSGLQVSGDNNVINYIKEKVGKPYSEATARLEEKSKAFENNTIDWSAQWARIEDSALGNKGKEVTTGFIDLDKKIGNLTGSQLVALLGIPGSGKTTLALDIARYNSVKNNLPVFYFSLGTKTALLIDRLISAEAMLEASKLRMGTISSDEEFSRLRDALDSLAMAPIFIDETVYLSIEGIGKKILDFGEEIKGGVVIIDGLELLDSDKDLKSTLVKIKRLTSQAQLPIIVVSQLSRDPIARRGGNLRASDLPEAFVQISDVVIAMEPNYEEDSSIRRISILKNRNGRCNTIELYKDEISMAFFNIEKGNFSSLSS